MSIVKITLSKAGVWQPSPTQLQKKVADAGEVTALKLSCASSSAFMYIYDAADASQAIPANLKWVLDCSLTDNDYQIFSSPIVFDKGVYAVCDSGFNDNAFLCIARSGV